MFSRSGKEKWVLTFSLSMVNMLNVYRMVLKQRMWGSFLKHALKVDAVRIELDVVFVDAYRFSALTFLPH